MHPLRKVMEHIIVSNIWKHLHKHDIILHFQHGFQSGLSCESQLIETVHDWMTALDNKTQTDAILLDFAKAFDKVPHKRLLSKLISYGITIVTHTIGSHLFYRIVSSESRLMEPCRTSQMLHLVSHRDQFWELYSSCCTLTTSTKTFNRVSAYFQMIALYIAK